MRHLRIINRAIAAAKNIEFRSVDELLKSARSIGKELDLLETQIQSYEVAAGERKLNTSADNRKVNIDAPTQKTLESNFSILVELDDRAKSLDAMIAQLEYQFSGETGHKAALKEVTALRKRVNEQVREVYDIVNTIATDHIPEGFNTMLTKTFDQILEGCKGYYSKSDRRLLVNMDGANVQYTAYLRMLNLVDDAEYTYKEYCAVLTYFTGPDYPKPETYVNTLSRFVTPGRFNPGERVGNGNVDDAVASIWTLMVSENFAVMVQGDELPLGDDDLKADKFSSVASKVKIDTKTNELIFTLLPEKRKEPARKRAIQDLYVLLRGLLESKSNPTGDIIKSRKFDPNLKYRETSTQVIFQVRTDKPLPLNRVQLRAMQDDLGLSDTQVKSIMQMVL